MRSVPALLLLLGAGGPAFAQAATTTVASSPGGSQTVVTSAAGTPATATTTVTTTPAGTSVKTVAADPKTKLVCQYTETLGTRLGGHKVCMTRQQWRESAVQDRAAIDHAQISRGIVGN